jgi:hypothetical protein
VVVGAIRRHVREDRGDHAGHMQVRLFARATISGLIHALMASFVAMAFEFGSLIIARRRRTRVTLIVGLDLRAYADQLERLVEAMLDEQLHAIWSAQARAQFITQQRRALASACS